MTNWKELLQADAEVRAKELPNRSPGDIFKMGAGFIRSAEFSNARILKLIEALEDVGKHGRGTGAQKAVRARIALEELQKELEGK